MPDQTEICTGPDDVVLAGAVLDEDEDEQAASVVRTAAVIAMVGIVLRMMLS
jgi:hypothetical protein